MCCLFTCCGWIVDLIQRCWTFTMSCCISSAVCCSLLTASMSGVALGYNYSLAEYIDLKETNVSVYMKRGIFDDEIADDMDWRRSGHQPVAGHIGEDNLMTGMSDEASTLRSGRRLDDSLFLSNDRNNFEGSLMKLTAKPLDASPVYETTPYDEPLGEIIKPFQSGSIDQLKAVQSAINMKKALGAARRTGKKGQDYPASENEPNFAYPGQGGRRMMKFDVPPYPQSSTYYSHRMAVPDANINDPSKWFIPKSHPHYVPKDANVLNQLGILDYGNPTYPSPVTPRAGPVRPTKTTPLFRRTTTTKKSPTRSPQAPAYNLPKSIDEEMESFKEKPLGNKFDVPGIKNDIFPKKIEGNMKNTYEDYDEESIKGVPLRKKRDADSPVLKKLLEVNKITKNNDSDTPNASIQSNFMLKIFKLDERQHSDGKVKNAIVPLKESNVTETLLNVLKVSKSTVMKLFIATTVS